MAEEWDVFHLVPGAGAPVLLATLYEAFQKTIRVELNGPGAGSFAINRASPECTEAILAQGNLVKVRIPEVHTDYIFAFFLETGDFTLISSQEAGGETLTFGGRGILSYLEYARAWSTSYITGGQSPIAGVWRAYAAGTGSKPGQILRRLIEEFQDTDRPQAPLPHLTINFDYTNDTTADPWDDTDATDEFAYQVGEDGLAILVRLIETGTITVQMSPSFLLSAYNPANYGRDLAGDAFGSGVVRFQRGINIATEFRRELAVLEVATHMLAAGEADKYGTAALSDATSRVTKEGFIPAFGTGTTALNGIAAAELRDRLRKSDTIQFPIANRRTDVSLADPVTVGSVLSTPGLATAGYYLPGPIGTLGDFWVGDTVRVHTGSGEFDYEETDWRVGAITITREDDNHELIVIPELVEPAPSPVCPDIGYPLTDAGYYPPLGTGVADADGWTVYSHTGLAQPETPSPFFGSPPNPNVFMWHFSQFMQADAGAHNPAGWTDSIFGEATNTAKMIPVGPGTATVYTRIAANRSAGAFNWRLEHRVPGAPQPTTDAVGIDIVAGTTFEVVVPDDGYCIHFITLDGSTTPSSPYGGAAFDGWDWDPA